MYKTGKTFGLELEWADWDNRQELPSCVSWNHQDYTIVNSNGVGNDPLGKVYHYGGELNTIPTDSIEKQVAVVEEAKRGVKNWTINYKSNLHIHIAVPGLIEDLETLKRMQHWFHDNYKPIIDAVDNLKPFKTGNKVCDAQVRILEGLRNRIVTQVQLDRQDTAKTVEEFFNLEAPQTKDGKPMFHISPRMALNIRQLKDTGTVEFRHFCSTVDPEEVYNAIRLCEIIFDSAIDGSSNAEALEYIRTHKMPQQLPMDEFLQRGWNATNVAHDRTTAPERIANWLKENNLEMPA